MVHALREVHRVLMPEGLLIDLRPAAIHRRVGVTTGDEYRLSWVMRETFEDDIAADIAVNEVLNECLFDLQGRRRIPCYHVMDTLEDLEAWLADFVRKGNFASHDWLTRRVERVISAAQDKPRIVVSAPLVMRVMRKLSAE